VGRGKVRYILMTHVENRANQPLHYLPSLITGLSINLPFPRSEMHLLEEILARVQGTGIDEEDVLGMTPLVKAAGRGSEASIALLVGHGATLDFETSTGRLPLMEAVRSSRLENVRLLIGLGASVDRQNCRGQTAIWWAQKLKQAHIVDVLQRESRVNSSQQNLYTFISQGDIKSLREVLQEGEPFRINHVAMLKQELIEAERDAQAQKAKLQWLHDAHADMPSTHEAMHQSLMEDQALLTSLEQGAALLQISNSSSEHSLSEEDSVVTCNTLERLEHEANDCYHEALSALQAVCGPREIEMHLLQEDSKSLNILRAVALIVGMRFPEFECAKCPDSILPENDEIVQVVVPALEDGSLVHRARHLARRLVIPSSLAAARLSLQETDWGASSVDSAVRALGMWTRAMDLWDRLEQAPPDTIVSSAKSVAAEALVVQSRIRRAKVDLKLASARERMLQDEIDVVRQDTLRAWAKVSWIRERLHIANLMATVS
jgi:hypothetical protein